MTERPTRVGVLGAGLMGHGIAYSFAREGVKVDVVEISPLARASLAARLEHCREVCGVDFEPIAVLSEFPAPGGWDVELVLEAVSEDVGTKRSAIAAAAHAAPEATIASNTSVIGLSQLVSDAPYANRTLIAHWWNPPHLIDIVELLVGDACAPSRGNRVSAWLTAIGKRVVPVDMEVPGLIGNRLQFAMWREAFSLLERGVCNAEALDTVVRGTFGQRLAAVGPVESADYIGLGLTVAILDHLAPSLANSTAAPKILRDLVDAGQLGAESGSGLRLWSSADVARVRDRLERELLRRRGHRSD